MRVLTLTMLPTRVQHASTARLSSTRSSRRDAAAAETQSDQHVVLYNSNADDSEDPTRVGLLAARNFDVRSPLASITKDQVRQVARELGLPNHAHAAAPCLRSRLAFGVRATEDHLRAVEAAESIVRARLDLGVADNLRVRLLPGGLAALEVDHELLPHAQAAMFQEGHGEVGDSGKSLAKMLAEVGFPRLKVRSFKTGSVSGYNPSSSLPSSLGRATISVTTERGFSTVTNNNQQQLGTAWDALGSTPKLPGGARAI